MKKTSLVTVALLLCIVFPLSSSKVFATSWVYPFIVWDDHVYVVSEETVLDVEKKIGKVTKYSDMYSYSGNFSNVFPKGTKYYSIKGIDTTIAIAIQTSDGHYIKAYREGEYTYRKNFTEYIYIGLGVFAILVVGILIYSRIRRKDE